MEDKDAEKIRELSEGKQDYLNSTANPQYQQKSDYNGHQYIGKKVPKDKQKNRTNKKIDEVGANVLNKMGVPKPIAKKLIKNNKGKLLSTNLPGSKLINNRLKNNLSNHSSKSSNTEQKLKNINQNRLNLYNNLRPKISKTDEEGIETNDKTKSKKVSKNILGSIINRESKSKSEYGAQNFNSSTILGLPKQLAVIGIMAFFIIMVVAIITSILSISEDDDSDLNSQSNVKEYITSNMSEDELVDTLIDMNLCSSHINDENYMDECLNSPAGKYFTHLKTLYKQYSNYKDINGDPISLNISVILETVSYGYTDAELFDEDNLENILKQADDLANAQVELYQEYGDLYTANGNKCSVTKDKAIQGASKTNSYYRINMDKYISYLLYGQVHENYKNEVRKIDVDIHPDSSESCIPKNRIYKGSTVEQTKITYTGQIKDGYLYKNVLSKSSISDSELATVAQEAITEILERSKESTNMGIASISGLCSGVVVTGEYEGVYSLDDYVAGVVQRENNWHIGDNIENMKAQAVAARTYVLRITNNCQNSIENSTRYQTMTTNIGDYARRAAAETSGQVLVDSTGTYISTQYDALAVKEIIGDYYILKQANLKIPADWINSHISSSELDYYKKHSHGNGMSQWGSRYLQTQGYKYEQILSTFYQNGSLNSLNTAVQDIPSSVNDLKNRYYFIYDMDIYRNNTLFSQCVWYAKHRAMEILASSSYDENTKKTLINSINNTRGNGQDWYNNPNSTYFQKSRNINDAKAGAIVSWTRGEYGHVAIVESVYTLNGQTMVTLTEGWRTRNSAKDWYVTSDLWSVANLQKSELTLEQLKNHSGTFNGYVYLLG